jgi:hypothetical protein
MGRMFESFNELNRSWDERSLESVPPCKLFMMILLLVFTIGMNIAMIGYSALRIHHFDLFDVVVVVMNTLIAVRLARPLYRRL